MSVRSFSESSAIREKTDPMRCDYMPVGGGRPETGQSDALLGCKVTWSHGKQFRKHFSPHAYLMSRTHQLYSQYFLKGRGKYNKPCTINSRRRLSGWEWASGWGHGEGTGIVGEFSVFTVVTAKDSQHFSEALGQSLNMRSFDHM